MYKRQVLLLDEVEKAHNDVFNILLQVLEDGRLTDGQGRTVDFRNTLIIMTSNLGSDVIQECTDESGYVEMKRRVIDVVTSYFRPEFINRIDDSVVFRNLGVEEIRKITTLQIDDLKQRLGIQGVELNVSESALEFLGNAGFDPVYGARPLRRVIQQRLENTLARRVLAGDLVTANEVYVDRDQQGLSIVACNGPQQNGNAVLSARKAS